MPRRRDPARGFPPTPGAPDPEYPATTILGLNGTSSERAASYAAPGQADTRTGLDVLTTGSPRPGTEVTDRPGRVDGHRVDQHGSVRAAWNTAWGAGPWMAGSADGAWATDIMSAAGIGGTAVGSRTWTDGEDDPTEIWTLPGHDEQPQQSSAGWSESSSARSAAGVPVAAAVRAGSGARGSADSAADAVAAPSLRPRGRRERPRSRGRRTRVVLVVAVTVLGVTALAAAGAYAFIRHGHSSAPTVTPAHTAAALPSPSPSAHLGKWQHIANRVGDPVPLTLAELFPSRVTAGPRNYLRTAERSSQSCSQAVFGSKLKAAVAKGCSQALRASYLSVNGKRMGTIGVLNLATSAAAARVGKVVRAPRQFVQPLQAAHGPTRNLGHGTGVVWAVAKGHYLILMWAQYASLHSPTTSHDRKVLMQFINDLYQKSVNQSLTRRMVTGSPLTP